MDEINERQLKMLTEAAEETFSNYLLYFPPDTVKDKPEKVTKLARTEQDVLGLIKLGLFKDITDEVQDEIGLEGVRAIALTELGEHLFRATRSKHIH